MVMAVPTGAIYTRHAQVVHMVEGGRRGQGARVPAQCDRGGDVRNWHEG
jgi:hypothetical protein